MVRFYLRREGILCGNLELQGAYVCYICSLLKMPLPTPSASLYNVSR